MSLLEDLKRQLRSKQEQASEAAIPTIKELDAVDLRLVAGGKAVVDHRFLQYGAFEQIVA